jgi:hypothetical protein
MEKKITTEKQEDENYEKYKTDREKLEKKVIDGLKRNPNKGSCFDYFKRENLIIFFESRTFIILSLIQTLLQCINATAVRVFTGIPTKEAYYISLFFIICYSVLALIGFVEAIFKALILGTRFFWKDGDMQYLNVYDLFIIIADMGVNIISTFYFFWVSVPESPEKLPDYFGSVITLRIISVFYSFLKLVFIERQKVKYHNSRC